MYVVECTPFFLLFKKLPNKYFFYIYCDTCKCCKDFFKMFFIHLHAVSSILILF